MLFICCISCKLLHIFDKYSNWFLYVIHPQGIGGKQLLCSAGKSFYVPGNVKSLYRKYYNFPQVFSLFYT